MEYYVLCALLFVGLVTDGVYGNNLFSVNLQVQSEVDIPGGMLAGVLDDEPGPDDSVYSDDDSNSTNVKLWEGDIIYTDEIYMLANDEESPYEIETNKKWRNAEIPFYINKGYQHSQLQNVMRSAVRGYDSQLKGCIKFKEFDSRSDIIRAGYRSWIAVHYKVGCYSNVGSIGGEQVISLGNGCHYKGTAMHEMLHALGFWHEQMRKDRDEYISIKWGNIIKDMDFNFKTKHFTSTMGEPYDINSIMHYPPNAFSANGQPTIVHRGGVTGFGWKQQLSKIDVKQLRKLYECDSRQGIKKDEEEECKDNNKHCKSYAEKGECRNNAGWMMVNCRKSCDNCPEPACKDTTAKCKNWKRFCTQKRYKEYMDLNCCATCKGESKPKPIDGNWSEWSDWTACTKTCGGGTQIRRRACTNPEPKNGGKSCPGNAKEDRNCNTDKCPIPVCVKDKSSICGRYKRFCKSDDRFINWMRTNCCVTCGYGKKPKANCKNKNSNCKLYKGKGYCTKYKGWMKTNCFKECGYCK